MFKTYNKFVLTGFLILSLAYLLLYNGFVYAGLQVRKVPFQVLYDYQLDKAQKTKAEIIFVGDSSLGNGIDAEIFSDICYRHVENFALTGSFGFKGSLLMAQQAYNANLKTIIIMQTLDMFTREIAKDYDPPKKIFQIGDFKGMDVSAFNFKALTAFIEALKKHNFKGDNDNPKFALKNDYIEQGTPNSPDLIYKALKTEDMQPEKIGELSKFASYCKKQKLNCVYVHGPIVEDICINSGDYISTINQIISDTGLKLASHKPVCIPKNKIGDAQDHVGPPFKEDFTKIFYELLKPYL